MGPPARGVLAGIKQDALKAKETGAAFDPNSVGSAWGHNFLNQKPWHPANFRNQARVFDAEQAAIREAKAKSEAKAQFDAEQEQLKALSYLSAEEQAKYSERQSISFMYMKPPGYDAGQTKAAAEAAEAAKAEAARAQAARPEQAGPSGPPGPRQEQEEEDRGQGRGRRPGPDQAKSSVGNMLGAMAALQQNEKFELIHMSTGMNRSPPRGGAAAGAQNQQFVMDDLEDEEPAPEPALDKKARKRAKLEEARAILRQHGLDVPEEDSDSADSEPRKHRHKKKKHKHDKHKKSKH